MQKLLGGLSSFVKLKLGLESCIPNLRNIILTDGKWTGFFTDLPCTTQELWGIVGLHHRPLEECSSQLEYNLVLPSSLNPLLWSLHNFQFLQEVKLLYSLMSFTARFIPRLGPSCALNITVKIWCNWNLWGQTVVTWIALLSWLFCKQCSSFVV